MQDARTRIGVAIVAVVAVIVIGIGLAVRKLQSPPPIVITDPAGAQTSTYVGPPANLAAPPTAATPSTTAQASDSTAATPSAQPAASSSTPDLIYIHVAGAVKKPGLYTLPPDSRLFQAMKVAGGAKADADTDAINLAEKLSDGEKVYVPTQQEMKSTPPAEAAGAGNEIGDQSEMPEQALADSAGDTGKKGAGGRGGGHSDKLTDPSQGTVDINTASADELQRLPGVGPAMAARILAFRQSAGGFKKPEELMEVSGIGRKNCENAAVYPHLAMASLPGDEFFQATGTLEYEEYGGYSIHSSKSLDNEIQLEILLDTGISDVPEQVWLVRCPGAVAHELHLTHEIDYPEVLDDHPLLWPRTKPGMSLWFYAPMAIEPNSVIGRLFEAHVALVGLYLVFGEFFNSHLSLSGLIAGRHGKLASGPEPLIAAYELVMRDCGFETSTKTSHKFWNGNGWEDQPPDLRLLLLGESYIVAEEFSWERTS